MKGTCDVTGTGDYHEVKVGVVLKLWFVTITQIFKYTNKLPTVMRCCKSNVRNANT